MDPVGSVTTAQMWVATYIAAALAVALLAVAAYRVRAPLPPRLEGTLLVVAVAWFGALYAWAAWSFWDTCYAAVLPAWGRIAAPAVGMLGGCLAWPFWWVSRRLLPRRPAIPFIVLGALHSLPGHLSGIYQRDLLEGCALVRGVSPASALTFGLFEFAIYWSGVLMVAHALARARGRRTGRS